MSEDGVEGRVPSGTVANQRATTAFWEEFACQFPVSGGVVTGVDVGRGSTAVVFLHGLGNSWHFFGETIATLSDSYRCIALDIPGFGGSTRLAPLTRESLTSELLEVISAATEGAQRVVVCGHSLGALIALELAENADDGQLAGVILVSPGLHELLQILQMPMRSLSDSPMAAVGLFLQLGISTVPTPRFVRRWALHNRVMRNMIVSRYANDVNSISEEALDFALSGLGRLATLQVASLAKSYSLAREREINCPSRIITGSHDVQAPPALARSLADSIGCLSLQIMDGVGHWPMLEAPGSFAELVRKSVETIEIQ